MTSGKRNYLLLSLFDFLYLFASVVDHGFLRYLDHPASWHQRHEDRAALLGQRLYRPADAAFLRLYL